MTPLLKVTRTSGDLLSDRGNMKIGVSLVVLSSLLFAMGGAATKQLSVSVPPSSALIWRTFISAVGIAVWFSFCGWPRLHSSRIDLHIARGAATFAGLWTYFAAVATIPLSTAVLLRTAAPVFVPVVAFTLYRRRSDVFVWLGAWIGLLGVALLVNPAALAIEPGSLLGVASGVLGAVGAVLIWRLGGIDGVGTQLLWLTIVGMMSSLFASPWLLTLPEASDWPLVIVMAATTTGSQVILAHAFQFAPADKVISWGYLSVVFGGILGAVLWSELPTLPAVTGMLLVVAGSHIASIKRRPTEAST